MNEHDSERLAGALVADGLVATTDMESADVVVFNTCCIRENADNKFYGHLGNLKALREARPGQKANRGRFRWHSSVVERHLGKVEVQGSSPCGSFGGIRHLAGCIATGFWAPAMPPP